MNILFITIAWPQPKERNIYSDLMEEFFRNKHNVYVLSGNNKNVKNDFSLTNESGINVLRVKTGKVTKVRYIEKIIALLTLNRKLFRALKSEFFILKIDLIIFHTPPITLSNLIKKVKRIFKCPVYLLLKDIWPQGAVDNKIFSKYSPQWIYLKYHEHNLYKIADHIGCMSPMGVEYLLRNYPFLMKEKVEVCPNSIKPSLKKSKVVELNIRAKYNIDKDVCVFLFSGNLARGHGLHFLVEAIKKLNNYTNAYFLIGGAGTHFNFIKKEFDKFKPKNALLYNRLPQEEYEAILETVDVGLILLDSCYTVPQFPSRLLSYLDNSKAVLCAVNEFTDVGKIVERNKCGKSVIHGDFYSFLDKIKYLSENREIRTQMGLNAKKLLLKDFTVVNSYKIIIQHFIN